MENQFSLAGLALLTPEIKELITLSENADFRTLEKMRIDEMRLQFAQYEKKLIHWEATGVLLPGAREAAAAKFETILASYVSGLKTDNQTALQAAQESDCKTVQDAYNAWLYTARPTPAQALVGAAKMRAEMRAAGIIEASPNAAPVGNPIAANSPARPALAVTPVPTPTPPAPIVAASPPPALSRPVNTQLVVKDISELCTTKEFQAEQFDELMAGLGAIKLDTLETLIPAGGHGLALFPAAYLAAVEKCLFRRVKPEIWVAAFKKRYSGFTISDSVSRYSPNQARPKFHKEFERATEWLNVNVRSKT